MDFNEIGLVEKIYMGRKHETTPDTIENWKSKVPDKSSYKNYKKEIIKI